jgi:hypothetical protein
MPAEIISYILEFVPYKMDAHLTCTSWAKHLQQLYNENKITNYNDMYYLTQYYNNDNLYSLREYYSKITYNNYMILKVHILRGKSSGKSLKKYNISSL